ncbi:unnamed protein product [Vitrella brassicaformis CCMP3155]|uniref:Amine oxidase domain-containing protein n=2 Tax=Vitrella brassicaformis TaxID=1169539 RepID=A0A0G4EET0_VITBC|nr:unnamed protein product [Vitrella brassicaformis CCMP3155]|eukprot:CEL94511.1 unnamed protein product [Vitrella brassicaformis CCMP3155]
MPPRETTRKEAADSSGTITHPEYIKASQDPARNVYDRSKIPADVDFIIVGSGVGGLWLAAALSKLKGYKCVVLEQHYMAGGLCHVFTHKGYEFIPGVHYIANKEVCGGLLELVSDPSTPVEWQLQGDATTADRRDEEAYRAHHGDVLAMDVAGGHAGTGAACSHEVVIGDLPKMSIRGGKSAVIDELVRVFPNEREAITKWIDLVDRVKWLPGIFMQSKGMPRWFQPIWVALLCGQYLKYAGATADKVFNDITDNPQLATVLSAFAGDLGENLREGSFIMQSAVIGHIMEGCWYPRGGPPQLTRTVIPTITKAGGGVFVSAKVDEILVEHGVATGVRLANGDVLKASKGVVSAVGLRPTFDKLLSRDVVRRYLKKEAARVDRYSEGAISHVYAFVALKGSAEELGLKSSSLYYIPWNTSQPMEASSIQDHYRSTLLDPSVEDVSAGMLFPTAKDPDYSEKKHPGRSVCIMFSEAIPEEFEHLKDDVGGVESKLLSEEYSGVKKVIERKLINALLHNFPHLKDHIEFVEVGTPMTAYRFLRRFDSLGLRHTPARMTDMDLRPDCSVRNLYFSGQDIAFAGWAGALTGAMIAATRILGYTPLDLIRGKDLVTDLGGAELMKVMAKKAGIKTV